MGEHAADRAKGRKEGGARERRGGEVCTGVHGIVGRKEGEGEPCAGGRKGKEREEFGPMMVYKKRMNVLCIMEPRAWLATGAIYGKTSDSEKSANHEA